MSDSLGELVGVSLSLIIVIAALSIVPLVTNNRMNMDFTGVARILMNISSAVGIIVVEGIICRLVIRNNMRRL